MNTFDLALKIVDEVLNSPEGKDVKIDRYEAAKKIEILLIRNSGKDFFPNIPINPFGTKAAPHQRCVWDSIPEEDRGKPMGISCPCPRCSAYSMATVNNG